MAADDEKEERQMCWTQSKGRSIIVKDRSVTINDIARIAGVSKKSVSRVLNDESGISEETRAHIKSIMAEQGYQPDRRARALAGHKSFLIALVYNNPNPAYVVEMLKGVQSVAGKDGYEIVMHAVTMDAARAAEDIQLFMRRSGCDGLILTPPLSEMADILGSEELRKWPIVRIAGDDVSLEIPQIRYDDRSGAIFVTAHLLDLGHTRIGFVGGARDSGPTRRRLAGFRDALSSRGIAADEALEAFGDFSFRFGEEAARRLLALPARPTAFMCCNDEIAAGVIHAVRESDLRVPLNVSVSGFDDSALAQQVWPPLTSVRQPVQEMGAAAAAHLLATMHNDVLQNARRDFEHSLVIRRSTAPPAPQN